MELEEVFLLLFMIFLGLTILSVSMFALFLYLVNCKNKDISDGVATTTLFSIGVNALLSFLFFGIFLFLIMVG